LAAAYRVVAPQRHPTIRPPRQPSRPNLVPCPSQFACPTVTKPQAPPPASGVRRNPSRFSLPPPDQTEVVRHTGADRTIPAGVSRHVRANHEPCQAPPREAKRPAVPHHGATGGEPVSAVRRVLGLPGGQARACRNCRSRPHRRPGRARRQVAAPDHACANQGPPLCSAATRKRCPPACVHVGTHGGELGANGI